MKKLLFLGDSSIIHTQKWIEYYNNIFDIYVISAQKSKELNGVVYYYIDKFMAYGKLGYIFSIPMVNSIIDSIKPDLIHAHHAMSYGFIAAITKREIPFIVTAHGSDVLISADQNRINRLLIKYTFNKADIINSVAQHMSNKIMEIGVTKNKIITLQYGIDSNCFFPIQKESKKNRSPIFISTRQFKSIYNHDYLIKIAKKLQEMNVEFTLWFVGDGITLPEIKKQVRDLNLTHCVKFFGKKEQKELNVLLNSADYYISLSLSDGTSLCLLEAFATKTFPIVSDIPANRELINENSDGLLLDLNNIDLATKKIFDLLTSFDNEKTYELNRNFLLVLEHFSQEKNFKKFEKIYDDLINKKGVKCI